MACATASESRTFSLTSPGSILLDRAWCLRLRLFFIPTGQPLKENVGSPRLGAAIQIPWLKWIIRGAYSRFYQAPPLGTVSGPLLDFATGQGLAFLPLHGERDEQHQAGLTIPVRGWAFDFDY